jgi:hypothetical protein
VARLTRKQVKQLEKDIGIAAFIKLALSSLHRLLADKKIVKKGELWKSFQREIHMAELCGMVKIRRRKPREKKPTEAIT